MMKTVGYMNKFEKSFLSKFKLDSLVFFACYKDGTGVYIGYKNNLLYYSKYFLFCFYMIMYFLLLSLRVSLRNLRIVYRMISNMGPVCKYTSNTK